MCQEKQNLREFQGMQLFHAHLSPFSVMGEV